MTQRDQPAAPARPGRDFSQAADAEAGSLLRTDLMNEAGSPVAGRYARPSYQESKSHISHSTAASTTFSSSLLPKTHLRSFFRRLGHKFNPRQRFKGLDNNEPRKEVCSNSRSSALWHFILFHLPAVLTTLVLLVLYIKDVRWDSPHPTADELGALQFAAKAHEALILVSLADILLHRIRYGLLGESGIPLGFLLSPFHIGFPLRYLVSWEFWSAVSNPSVNRYFHAATVAMIFIHSLLGLAAGPSSAIAMIPRLDWWQLSASTTDSFFQTSGEDKRAQIVERNPYAINLNSRHIPQLKVCDEYSNRTCVNDDLAVILQTLRQILPAGHSLLTTDGPILTGNISVSSPGPPNRQITLLVSNWSPTAYWEDISVAVTPMDFVAQGLRSDWTASTSLEWRPEILIKSEALILSGKEKWKQPLVAVRCAHPILNETTAASAPANPATFEFEDFGEGIHKKFTLILNYSDTPELQNILEKADDEAYDNGTAVFLDIQHRLPEPISASIILLPYLNDLLTSTLCLVQALWVEAEVWLYPKESFEIQIHLEFPIADAIGYIQQLPNNEKAIKMTDEWLRDIGVHPNSSSTPRENLAYVQAMEFCDDLNGGWNSTGCLPSFLAAYLANALSRIADIKGDIQSSASSPSPISNSTVIYNTYFEHVYAYRFKASSTIRLAFTALLLQVFIALIHLALLMFSCQPWHCSAWGDFGQLLTLALRSKAPDELRNVGAGVQSSRTWKLTTIIREVGEEKQLEMVVGAPTGMSHQGQTNMGVKGRGATQMRVPKVGTRY